MIEQLYNTNLTRPNKLSTKINTFLSRTKISQKDQRLNSSSNMVDKKPNKTIRNLRVISVAAENKYLILEKIDRQI